MLQTPTVLSVVETISLKNSFNILQYIADVPLRNYSHSFNILHDLSLGFCILQYFYSAIRLSASAMFDKLGLQCLVPRLLKLR